MDNLDHQFDFDLEFAYDVSVPLDETFAYVAINLRDRLNSMDGCCRIILEPGYKENLKHQEFVWDLLPHVLVNLESMQAKVEKLAEVRGHVSNSSKTGPAMRVQGFSNIEKVDVIPIEIPPEEVLVDLVRYFHFGTPRLREYAGKLLQREEATLAAEAMKMVLQMIKDYWKGNLDEK
jgi:hypothetical protein